MDNRVVCETDLNQQSGQRKNRKKHKGRRESASSASFANFAVPLHRPYRSKVNAPL